MKSGERIAEVPQKERKSWQAPVVEVLVIRDTEFHIHAGNDQVSGS